MLLIEKELLFQSLCPHFLGASITALVKNSPTSESLQHEINQEIAKLCEQYTTVTIKDRSGICATREAYRILGKDPSRYRPSCEQLARRAVQGKGLYSISTLVDLGNLLSLISGYSVAVLDADKIEGERLLLGVGKEEEPYEAIGRGVLNVASLPIYRDAIGGIATPTSDHVRTMISENTTRVLILINAYDGRKENLHAAIATTQHLLTTYAEAKEISVSYY